SPLPRRAGAPRVAVVRRPEDAATLRRGGRAIGVTVGETTSPAVRAPPAGGRVLPREAGAAGRPADPLLARARRRRGGADRRVRGEAGVAPRGGPVSVARRRRRPAQR